MIIICFNYYLSFSCAEYLERQDLFLFSIPSDRLAVEYAILYQIAASIFESLNDIWILASIVLLISTVYIDLTIVRDMYLPNCYIILNDLKFQLLCFERTNSQSFISI